MRLDAPPSDRSGCASAIRCAFKSPRDVGRFTASEKHRPVNHATGFGSRQIDAAGVHALPYAARSLQNR